MRVDVNSAGVSTAHSKGDLSAVYTSDELNVRASGGGELNATYDATTGNTGVKVRGSAILGYQSGDETLFVNAGGGVDVVKDNNQSLSGTVESDGVVRAIYSNEQLSTDVTLTTDSYSKLHDDTFDYSSSLGVSGSYVDEAIFVTGKTSLSEKGTASTNASGDFTNISHLKFNADLQVDAPLLASTAGTDPETGLTDVFAYASGDTTDSVNLFTSTVESTLDGSGYICIGEYSKESEVDHCIGFSGHFQGNFSESIVPGFQQYDSKESGLLTTCKGDSHYVDKGSQWHCNGSERKYVLPILPFGSQMAMTRP